MAMVHYFVLTLSIGGVSFIFLDYHKKENIHKAIIFAVVVTVSMVFLGILVKALEFKVLYLLPVFAVLPFAISFVFRSR